MTDTSQTNISLPEKCIICNKRAFATKRGLNTHMSACRRKNPSSVIESTNSNPIATTGTNEHPCIIPIVYEPKIWGKHSVDTLRLIINTVYEKIVFWRPNLFLVPTGAAGKKFVSETTRFIDYWNDQSEFFASISL